MNVAFDQPEEILFTWDSGFGNNELGSTEDVLGTDGTIARGQQIRYLPQKVNRPQGTEMLGNNRTGANETKAHIQNFLDSVRGTAEPNCPFEVGFRVPLPSSIAADTCT